MLLGNTIATGRAVQGARIEKFSRFPGSLHLARG